MKKPLRDSLGQVLRRASLLALIAVGLLGSGCAFLTREFGEPLPLDEIGGIKAKSNYSQVLEKFGPPTNMSALSDGMAFQYEYIELKERQYGLIFPGKIGKWIKAVFAKADASYEVMVFNFDEEGTLRSYGTDAWESNAGSGFSVTLIFSVGSLTDTEKYQQAMTNTLEWGAALTKPPLQTLNAQQSLNTGANGVELTATGTKVGQHSLELRE